MHFSAPTIIGLAAIAQPALACLNYNYSIDPANNCLTAYFNDDNQQICQGTACPGRGADFWDIPCPSGYRLRLSDISNPRRYADFYIEYGTPHGTWTWTQLTAVGGPPYKASGNHFC